MRKKLKNIVESDYWIYGLSEQDFDYTLRLAKEFIEARKAILEQYAEKTRKEQPDVADDILDDVAYYTHVDIDYLWHYCLWRLQAILEGLIVYAFLPSQPAKPLIGLKAKLDTLRTSGYSLSQNDYQELIDWGKLRNALSHAPPEQYRPGPLRENDVLEYKILAERLCQHWRIEQSQRQNP